jgi:hypothetical protein
MRKFAVAALLLVISAAPAFAVWPFHKKPPKDPRFSEHPKTQHQANDHYKNVPKHKMQKHPVTATNK